MAGNIGVWGWDTANTEWVKVLVDNLGHLQIDVLTSALPAGGATAANQATIIGHIDGIEGALGNCYGWDGGEWLPLLFEADDVQNLRVRLYGGANAVLVGQSSAALAYTNYGIETFAILYGDDGTNLSRVGMLLDGADAVVNSLNTLGVASMLYGYNGGTWDRLRVQSAAYPNLRVSIYEDNKRVDLIDTFVSMARTTGGLATRSPIYALSPTAFEPLLAQGTHLDGQTAAQYGLMVASRLHGFNDTTWDRLRSYTTGILKVGRAEAGLLTVRKTVVGQVGAAGVRKLYWMTMNPTAANSVIELTDDTDGSTAVVWDMRHGVNSSHHMNLDPPMEFANGIYLKTFTNMTSCIFGYL